MASSLGSHPWAPHLNVRKNLQITCNFDPCDLDPAPHIFNHRDLIRVPDSSKARCIRECVTLDEVVAFRDETAKLKLQPASNKPDEVSSLSMGLESLSLDNKNYRIIYRYTDLIKKKSLAILEAIHFEIFMPDRQDLRFILMPLTLLPWDACEGDYFEIHEVKHTRHAFSVIFGLNYTSSWTVTRFSRVERQGNSVQDYIYVTDKDGGTASSEPNDRKAVCNWSSNFIQPRHQRFNKKVGENQMNSHRIYDANLVDTSSAWIYPVEPPKNREEYWKLVQNVRSTSHFAGTFAHEINVLSTTDQDRIDDRLADFREFSWNMQMAELHMLRLFKLGVRFRQLITPAPKENVYIQSIDPPILQVYTEIFYLDAVTLHVEEDEDVKLTVDHIKRENNGKKKNTYIHCVRSPDLLRVLGARPSNLWMDATLHGEGGSATERILDRIDNEMAEVETNGEVKADFAMDTQIPKMIQAMYGDSVEKDDYVTLDFCTVRRNNGEALRLNAEQTRAMGIYHKIQNSGYCILSPPGSGKTTVAAAMAASLVKDKFANRQGSVQMLMAVQNVAVENLAAALKTFDDGTLRSYRLLSKMRTDPSDPTPYDIFDHFPNYLRWMNNAARKDRLVMDKFFELEAQWKSSERKGSSLNKKEKEELNLLYTQSMLQAKATLEKHMQPHIILSTVDLALYRLQDAAENGVRGQFWDVDRIIIDEASLLTESTFYCLVRCFPKASFVLIGDDKQLPPFMYDQKVLGHELAGRAALNVAMQRKNLPIIQLVEVYRAPQQLVQPYNNLSYAGTLVSRKKESSRPLFEVGLVSESRPDLLLIDIPKGHQKGSPSPYNDMEIEALLKLLDLFTKSKHDDIMIICLYKAQQKRLQRRLGPDYEIMTVDSSQGKEKSIVIVLTTRTEKVTDFFSNQNRCTVAVSRHQRSLIILGNNSLLSSQLPWSKVLEDFTRIEPAQIPEPQCAPGPVPKTWADINHIPASAPLPKNPWIHFNETKTEASQAPSVELDTIDFPALEVLISASTATIQPPAPIPLKPLPTPPLVIPTQAPTVIRNGTLICPGEEAKKKIWPPKKKTTQERKEQRRRAKERAAASLNVPPWKLPQTPLPPPPPSTFTFDSSDFPDL